MADQQNWREAAKRELAEEVSAESSALSRDIAARNELDEKIEARRSGIQAKLDAARALGMDLEPADFVEQPKSDPKRAPASGGDVTAREVILDALREAFPKPMKAAQLREIIEERLGREIHYKTPGMTLYRLAEANEVYRKGHQWYLMTEDHDGENEAEEREFEL